MCGVPVHAAESYLARLIRARPSRRHRRADREPRRSAQGARLEGAGRPRDHPPGHAGDADRRDLARILRRPTGSRRSAGPATNGRSPPPTFRPAGSSWSPAGPASWPPSWRACRRPRPSPNSPVPGLRTTAGQGRVRQPRRRARAQGALRPRDARRDRQPVARRACGRGRPARLSRRDAEGRRHLARRAAARVALGAHGDRCRDPRQPRADPLGLGQRRRKPARRDRPLPDGGRPPPARGRHLRAADRSRARSSSGSRWSPGFTRMRFGASGCASALKAMPDFARALARLTAGRGSPRDLAVLRDGLSAAAALRQELGGEPDRPALLDCLLPRLGGHDALVEQARPRPGRIAADRCQQGRLHRRRL